MDEKGIERKGSGLRRQRPTRGNNTDQQITVEQSPGEGHLTTTLMVLGIIFGIVTYFIVGKLTLVSNEYLARAYVLIGLVGTLIPMKFLAMRLGLERLEWVLFNVLAVGPIVLSTLLWLNFLIHSEPTWVEHPIESVGHFNSQWRVELDHGAFAALPGFREFDQNEPGLPHIKAVRFALAEGCLGKTVLVEREAVPLD